MATVIDALLVTLGLDSSGFKKGTEDAAKAQSRLEKLLKKDSKEREGIDKKATHAQKVRAKGFEEQGKKAAETFGKIRSHALGLIAVLAGGVGIAEFGKEMITGAASMKRLADNMGVPMKQVQAFAASVQSVGGTTKGAENGLLGMANSLAGLKMGVITGQMEGMRKWGVHITRSGNALTQMLNVSRKLSEVYKTDPIKAQAMGEEMGIDESLFNLLKHYNKTKQLLAHFEKNPAYSQSEGKQAERVQQQLTNFRNSLKKTMTAIAFQFLPIFEKLLVKFQEWANWASSHQSQIVGWVDGFVTSLEKLAVALNKAAQFVGGWKNVLIGLAALKVLSIVSPLLSLAGALVKVGAGLAEITAGGGALGILAKIGLVGGVGVAALLHSQSLDTGEKGALAHAEKRAEVMAKLQKLGFSRGDSAAIAANLSAESNFNPGAIGDNGHAYGLAQWHLPRQEEFAKVMGRPIQGSTVDQQLKFLKWELENKYANAYRKMQQTQSVYWKSAIFTQDYERPANVQVQIAKRAKIAQQYMADPAVSWSPVGRRITVPRVSAEQSAPVSRSSVVNHNSTSKATIGQVVVQTNSQDPGKHGRMVSDAINRYLFADPLNSAFL